jgi:DNA-binding HxlR family transcriptional regulator
METKIDWAGRRSDCPIASALDLFGDKWSLLIVRDIGLFGRHRYKELETAGEGIPTNILAARLKHLAGIGIVERRQYQARPPRYEYHLTAAGQELLPVLGALADWSLRHIEGVQLPASVSARRSGGNR